MGFIERMMDAMKPAPGNTDTAPEENSSVESVPEAQTNEADAEPTNEEKENSEEEKTYSQQELDQILSDNKKVWETDRMNALSKDSQIEELKAELLRRDLKERVTARLEEAKLPLGVAEFVQYTDEAGTMDNLEKVIATVNKLVQDGVMMRLKGKTPEGLGMSQDTTTTPEFVRSFIGAMKD